MRGIRPWREDTDTCLVYHINESLGIVSREIFKYLELIVVREDGLYQTEALVRGKAGIDQPFPCGRVTRCDEHG